MLLPAEHTVPEAQGEQVVEEVAVAGLEKVPALQLVQVEDARADEYVPAGQG